MGISTFVAVHISHCIGSQPALEGAQPFRLSWASGVKMPVKSSSSPCEMPLALGETACELEHDKADVGKTRFYFTEFLPIYLFLFSTLFCLFLVQWRARVHVRHAVSNGAESSASSPNHHHHH